MTQTQIICIVDSTTSPFLSSLNAVLKEWSEIGRKGKVIIHMDGAGPKKIEYNYSVDL